MNYEKFVDAETQSVTIKRTDADGKVWWIPCDPANSDYQAYLATLVTESAPTAQ